MADEYANEKKMGKVRERIFDWFERLARRGDVEGEPNALPSLSEGEHRALKAGTEVYRQLIKEKAVDTPQQVVVNLEDVSTEELKQRLIEKKGNTAG